MQAVEIDTSEPASPPSRRRWVTVVLSLLVLLVVATAVLRLGGVDGNRFVVALVALTPYVSVFGLLVTLLALIARRRLLTFVALVAAVSMGVLLLPRSLPDGGQEAGGQHVRVMTLNLMFGRADAAEVVRLVRDAQADVLTLQELTPAAVSALDEAGIAEVLPYRVLRDKAGAAGSGILARVPLRQVVLVEGATFDQPAAVVDLSGGIDMEVVSVHVIPGVVSERGFAEWKHDLSVMPAVSPERVRVLSGDFNATLDHRAFGRVLERGYVDAAEVTGDGMRPTWSRGLSGPPVTIDHVVVDRRAGVVSVAVYEVSGTDHNAVVAQLAMPG